MGTTGIVRVWDEDDTEIMRLYAQSDGYPTEPGLGWLIAKFLKDAKLSDGVTSDLRGAFTFTGMDDFACRLVCYLKNEQIRGNREWATAGSKSWKAQTCMRGGGERVPGHLYMWSHAEPYQAESYEYVYDIRPAKPRGRITLGQPYGGLVMTCTQGDKRVALPKIEKPKEGGSKADLEKEDADAL